MSFASRLKMLMGEKDISQAELADQIGKGRSSVSQYLSGKNIPKNDVQHKIAKVLGCTIEQLNTETAVEFKDGLQNITIAEAAKRLSKSEQFIRISLQMGTAPFGFASKNKSKWSYHISPKKLAEYVDAN